MDQVTAIIAFGGGILAFISPCTLPLYPSFLSYIAGISVNELQSRSSNGVSSAVLKHSLLFLAGFSLVYYVLGFSASMLGQWFDLYRDLIRMLGAVFIFLLGCFMVGLIRPKFMMREMRFNAPKAGVGKSFGSFVTGIIFAAGWTPCIGPIFGAIMYTNIMNPDPWPTFVHITAYALGFGIPFLAMGYFIGKVKRLLKYSDLMMKVGGAIMIILAVMLYFDKVSWLNTWAN
ncbi:cytochrome c biogenesis CcdA family protein [Paenibacillus sp. L3-i20]|uniref:cytochrome c biogenesis CcdA family protein n=1 Tax=Paenibacillus sp. L3-i20 TaxID=2905833 RepID=UPI001EE10023|nr:cytochrome c biogenesis protein CcdA [Paenibacillus sp. L3-i20]